LTVSPTDPPNAITSTVKDFFALHNCGVSFTDAEGSILIVTPNNLANGMEVFVNQTLLDDGENKQRKRRKSGLSSRKRARKLNVESEILEVEVEEDVIDKVDHSEKRDKIERILSSEVSVENIIFDSSRRRLSKFSSEV
jgi:Tfp pilus assembly protein PilZ